MKLIDTIAKEMKQVMLIKRDFKNNIEVIESSNCMLAEMSILKNKLILAEKEKKSELTIQEEYKIVKKEKEENISVRVEFERGKREDLVSKCDCNICLLDRFITTLEENMPKQLSEEEISQEIEMVATILRGADTEKVFTKRETGLFMKELKVRLDGKADMKTVGKLLASVLG